MTKSRSRRFGGIALAVVCAAGVGYVIGHYDAVNAEWHTVTIRKAAVASDQGSHRLLTVNVDGWAYGIEDQVQHWVDESGVLHDSGWPTCLEPSNPGDGPQANPAEVTFRFAAAEVSTGILAWRPVVMVDCQG
jgi:hypothetical protein